MDKGGVKWQEGSEGLHQTFSFSGFKVLFFLKFLIKSCSLQNVCVLILFEYGALRVSVAAFRIRISRKFKVSGSGYKSMDLVSKSDSGYLESWYSFRY